MQRMRNLLVTATHKDARVTAFLTTWAYEKFWIADALDAVLEAGDNEHASETPAGATPTHPRRARRAPRPDRRAVAANFAGPQIVAAHVTTGLADEWITQAAYRRLGELAGGLHAVVGRIIAIKDRHIRFLSEEAQRRLAASPRASKLTRTEIKRAAWPIGAVDRVRRRPHVLRDHRLRHAGRRCRGPPHPGSGRRPARARVGRSDRFCETHTVTPKRASTDLGRSHVFLTGATGFVGQAVLERLLSDHPETTISILVRAKAGADTAGRVSVLLKKPAFDSWRERVGDAAVEKAAKERIRVVEGEMGSIPQLPKDLDVVIHSASVVSFDPPIDEAFDTNVNGAMQLYDEPARRQGRPARRARLDLLRRRAAQGRRARGAADPRRSTGAPSTPPRRRRAIASSSCRASPTSCGCSWMPRGPSTRRRARRRSPPPARRPGSRGSRAELVDVGRTRAQSLGWTDVYTLTKAFAERAAEELWGENGHRLSVVRPAIIESALQHPFPGWIDGFKVADPLIMAYGRGLLPEFPGLPDSILDVIPVDFVVNAIIAAAANPAEKNAPEYYHVASGASNPLPFHEISGYVNQFFVANPMKDKAGKDIPVPTWKFPVGNKVERDVLRKERLVIRLENACSGACPTPTGCAAGTPR